MSINQLLNFGVEGKNIRFGFNAVKSMGRPTLLRLLKKEPIMASFSLHAGLLLQGWQG